MADNEQVNTYKHNSISDSKKAMRETGCTGREKCNVVSHSNKSMRKSKADGSTFVYGLKDSQEQRSGYL